uniref:Uncharacterized protein n=1 Tax=Sphaerodactylus townsendi TaxID=933632 RepID=A0ACB8EHQ5_9SAUR
MLALVSCAKGAGTWPLQEWAQLTCVSPKCPVISPTLAHMLVQGCWLQKDVTAAALSPPGGQHGAEFNTEKTERLLFLHTAMYLKGKHILEQLLKFMPIEI